jgi:hypothetical protein
LEGRPVDIIKISSSVLSPTPRPVIFLSARVHPGEVPGHFAWLGALHFALSDDPRAQALRQYCDVGKKIKMILIYNF